MDRGQPMWRQNTYPQTSAANRPGSQATVSAATAARAQDPSAAGPQRIWDLLVVRPMGLDNDCRFYPYFRTSQGKPNSPQTSHVRCPTSTEPTSLCPQPPTWRTWASASALWASPTPVPTFKSLLNASDGGNSFALEDLTNQPACSHLAGLSSPP